MCDIKWAADDRKTISQRWSRVEVVLWHHHGPGQLIITEGKMNSQVYETVFQNNVRKHFKRIGAKGGSTICRGPRTLPSRNCAHVVTAFTLRCIRSILFVCLLELVTLMKTRSHFNIAVNIKTRCVLRVHSPLFKNVSQQLWIDIISGRLSHTV